MKREDVEDLYELSPLQQGILVHELRDPSSRLYVVDITAELETVDIAKLEAALRAVIARTPALRTSIHWEALDKPLQLVHRAIRAPLVVGTPAGAEASAGFALDEPPLFRLAVIPDGARQRLVWTYHHILLDGWSSALVLEDLLRAYRGERLPDRRPYADYIGWIQGQDPTRADEFWRGNLAHVSGPTSLPTLRLPAPGSVMRRRSLPVRIAPDVVVRLRAAATRLRVTLGTLVHAAWGLMLHRTSGDRTIVFGATVTGRGASLDGIDGMIGLFINTLPVVLEIDPGRRLGSWLVDVQDRLVAMREYEHAPLVEIRRASRIAAGLPLFHSVVVFEPFAARDPAFSPATGATLRSAGPGEQGTDLPVSLCLAELPEGLAGSLTFDGARLADWFMEAIPGHLGVLLAAMPDAIDRSLRDLPVMTDAQRQRVVHHGAPVELSDATMHELFARRARACPMAIAIVHGERRVTYSGIASAAARLCRRLRDLGVRVEARVGLCCARSPEMIAAMYGILAAGGAYVPLDPAYPEDRLTYIAASAGISCIVGDRASVARLPALSVPAIDLEPIDDRDGGGGLEAPAAALGSARNLAYILYTSGSTGQPKGVAIEHRSAVVLVRWARATYSDEQLRGVLASTSINFDCSIFEIFAPLSWGGTVILADSSAQIPVVPAPYEIVVASLVPSNLLAQLRAGTLPATLRGVNLGGEASPRELVELLAAHHRDLEIFHVYGPTEDTTYTTCARLHVTHGETMPIGRPLPGTSVYLLDATGALSVPGCVGEVYIEGIGLARGYVDRPDLTADRFVPDHVGGAPGGRLYRTGDLGRQRADGEIELVGRVDQQVKIRGYRIELAEIDATLERHPSVADAACVVRVAEDGDRFLVAFLTARPGAAIDGDELRPWVRARLPAPMVPGTLVVLDAMPRNPNGKIDRRALPARDARAVAPPRRTGEPPRDRLELELARIWEELLAIDAVDIDDEFVDLGGHSLHAVSVLSRIQRTTGVRLPFSTLQDAATIRTLARAVRDHRSAPPNPLVTLRGRGDGAPSFWIHPALGGVLCYGALARALAFDAPLYAFQAQGLDDDGPILSSIDALATRYLAELCRTAPVGPVVIGGWSFGAVVAHEMASRLERAGRPPDRLLLVDPPPPGGAGEPGEEALLHAFAAHLGITREQVRRGERAGGLEPETLQRLFRVFSANLRAFGAHTPPSYGGPAHLFVAQERWDEPSEAIDAVWRDRAPRVRAIEIPGNHLTVLKPPYVATLAARIRDILDAAADQNPAVPMRT